MKLTKILFKKMIWIGLPLMILSFFVEEQLVFIKGLFGGMLYSLFNFHLIAFVATRAVRSSPKKAMVVTGIGYVVRYLLTALILVATILDSKTMFFGTILGLLSLKGSIHLLRKNEVEVSKGDSMNRFLDGKFL